MKAKTKLVQPYQCRACGDIWNYAVRGRSPVWCQACGCDELVKHGIPVRIIAAPEPLGDKENEKRRRQR